jgi:hypothetical protein
VGNDRRIANGFLLICKLAVVLQAFALVRTKLVSSKPLFMPTVNRRHQETRMVFGYPGQSPPLIRALEVTEHCLHFCGAITTLVVVITPVGRITRTSGDWQARRIGAGTRSGHWRGPRWRCERRFILSGIVRRDR